jgi:PhnB protein
MPTKKGGTMATELPNDPLESLRQPIVAIAPRAAFSTVLRHRLEEALGMSTSTSTSTSTSDSEREAATGNVFIPYLCVDGGARAIEFYGLAFGAVETMRIAEPDGKIGHADLRIGTAAFMLSDEWPDLGVTSPTTLGNSGVSLYLTVDDVDATFASAVAAGATIEREPADQFHGNRTATLRDPFGHRWMLATPIEDLSVEEMRSRAAAGGFETSAPPERSTPRSELGYWTLRVSDVDRAAVFYGELFGWTFESREDNDGRAYRHISNTAVPMGVHDDDTMPRQSLFYRIDDLEAAIARVRELGGEVLEVTDHPSGGNARCRDDQGVEFDLWKPAPGY